MIVIDANVAIYAYNTASPFYPRASAWFGEMLSSGSDVGIPMQSVLAFLRIATDAKLSTSPVTMAGALQTIDGWLSRPQVSILAPGPNHWTIFHELCVAMNANGKLTTDVHIAALALEHDATVYSADTDFARFPGLRWINPLVQNA